MVAKKEAHLISLFNSWSNEYVDNITLLPESGSYREYYRIKNSNYSALGVLNTDRKENIAFIALSRHFARLGLSVPEVYKEDLDNNVYLIEDLGDMTLFSYLSNARRHGGFSQGLVTIYKEVIEELTKFQILANKGLDYSICYPRSVFDKQSMMWDLSYFKYYFLKLAKVPFDEQRLEDDFNSFSDYLLCCDSNFFLYRDFQSANIMLYNNKPYFIDYQGGRRGALQYDIASLLFDSKADIPVKVRDKLLAHYIDIVKGFISINVGEFTSFFYGFVLIRLMQAMGAYGFRGFYEKKKYFLYSIPYALRNLESVLEVIDLPVNNRFTTLLDTLRLVIGSDYLNRFSSKVYSTYLTVFIRTFSYSSDEGINPRDGFIFDCRVINLYSVDVGNSFVDNIENVENVENVIEDTHIIKFMDNIYGIVDIAIDGYKATNCFKLNLSFGCTDDGIRSRFCANKLVDYLKEKDSVRVDIRYF